MTLHEEWLREAITEIKTTVKEMDSKVDAARESNIRTETILREGKFGERIAELEKFQERSEPVIAQVPALTRFRERFEGQRDLTKWALGSSGIALVAFFADRLGVI